MVDQQLSKKWIVYTIFLVVAPFWCAVGGFVIMDRATGNKTVIQLALLAFLLFVIFGAFLLWLNLLTQYDKNGVTFVTLRGKRRIKWTDIERLELWPSGVLLVTKTQRHLLDLTVYKHPDNVIRYIEQMTGGTLFHLGDASDI